MGLFKLLDNAAQSMIDKLNHGKIQGPVFYNEDNVNVAEEQLKDLLDKVEDNQRSIVEHELKLVEIGNQGENNIIYELKHSKENMIILHNITLEDCYKDSQIDFLVISKACIVVLETKKLAGDIEITKEGDFIRSYKNKEGKVYKKEGIYSPITQNEYHINAVRDLLVKNKLIKKLPIYSLVVIANPKTIIRNKANDDIKNKIVKYDQLNAKLKELINPSKSNDFDIPDFKMINIADLLMKENKPREYDFITRFNLKMKGETKKEEPKPYVKKETYVKKDTYVKKESYVKETKPTDNEALIKELKYFRFNQAKKENLKPYMIFNDVEMEEMISKNPKTPDELSKCRGFGPVKVQKYGNQLLDILKKYN